MPEVIVAIGTGKGLFLARSADRHSWTVDGPHHPMQRIAAVAIDTRGGTPTLLVGGRSEHWGPVVARSTDLGATWQEEEQAAVRFPEETGAAVEQIWQLQPGPPARPDEFWAGVEPAALFRSGDGGRSFDLVTGLWDHPHRPTWQPGFGGLCLHTVLPHPTDADKVTVAISTGGVYRSEDGGQTWSASNQGIEARFMPGPTPEYGQCVHKVTTLAGDPDTLVLQNHGGVFRSTDAGRTWQPAAEGLPADFGFGLAAHPRHAGTAYLFPLVADAMRLPPDGRARIYRSHDGGGSWHALTEGLPQEGFQSIVLRDALTTDDLDPAGVYFGTRSGEVWSSADEGDTWRPLTAHLPDVLCVRAAAVA